MSSGVDHDERRKTKSSHASCIFQFDKILVINAPTVYGGRFPILRYFF